MAHDEFRICEPVSKYSETKQKPPSPTGKSPAHGGTKADKRKRKAQRNQRKGNRK